MSTGILIVAAVNFLVGYTVGYLLGMTAKPKRTSDRRPE
jgi:hypothetical protein